MYLLMSLGTCCILLAEYSIPLTEEITFILYSEHIGLRGRVNEADSLPAVILIYGLQ